MESTMKKALSFNDTLLVPKFSTVTSRKDVSLKQTIMGLELSVPLISSNMDTVTEDKMAIALWKAGAIGCLHRFMSIEANVQMLKRVLEADAKCMVSVGITDNEFARAVALVESGASHVVIDVANGASETTVDFYIKLRNKYPGLFIVVGNFATATSYQTFTDNLEYHMQHPDAIKVGIGGGSNCSTRIVTGCGLPTLHSILDFKYMKHPLIIADGGISNSGDAAKALAAGADLVMCGNLLAGTEETPGETTYFDASGNPSMLSYLCRIDKNGLLVDEDVKMAISRAKKEYRGSASKVSYEVQGKLASHRAPEGVSRLVPYKGPVTPIIEEFAAGLKSSLSYCNAHDIIEFKKNAELVEISSAGYEESKPKG